jgi:hypothetical protein
VSRPRMSIGIWTKTRPKKPPNLWDEKWTRFNGCFNPKPFEFHLKEFLICLVCLNQEI